MLGLDYASSDDSDDSDVPAKRRATPTATRKPEPKRKPKPPRSLPRLPDTYDPPADDPAAHGGRVRARPFASGDWYAHVYVELALDAEAVAALAPMVQAAGDAVRGAVHSLLAPPQPGLHISLTHPLPLRGHIARGFAPALTAALVRARIPPFAVSLATPKIYHNDAVPRRAFVALRVGAGARELRAVLERVVRPAVRGEAYFAEPEWHASLAWCLDERTESDDSDDTEDNGEDTSPFPPSLVDTLEAQMSAVRKLPPWMVREICVKVGKDVVRIPLSA